MPKLFLAVLFIVISFNFPVQAGEWLNCKKQQVRNAKIDCSKYENGQKDNTTNSPKSNNPDKEQHLDQFKNNEKK